MGMGFQVSYLGERTTLTTATAPTIWLTTRQAARELHVTPGRIRQFVVEQRLPAYKGRNGRDLLIAAQDLNPLRDRRPGRPERARDT